jgi:hypothetical protein
MSLESYPILRITDEAAASLTAKTCAAVNTSGQLAAATANGADFAGVVVETDGATSAPYLASLQTHGVAILLSDGSGVIDEGNLVTVGASGKIKAVTPATGTNLRGIVGRALTPAAAIADLEVQVLLTPHVYIGA